ncbi:MAG: hypothetical protein J6T96_05420 [Bacteroidales bacterium]|nr:hypothetical protein [Bacteroidales bacterium]
MSDVYHCDVCGSELGFENTFFVTSSIGLCENCYERVTNRIPDELWWCCCDLIDGGSNECAEFLINLASEIPHIKGWNGTEWKELQYVYKKNA